METEIKTGLAFRLTWKLWLSAAAKTRMHVSLVARACVSVNKKQGPT